MVPEDTLNKIKRKGNMVWWRIFIIEPSKVTAFKFIRRLFAVAVKLKTAILKTQLLI
jgi:hypothetical protein